MNRQENLRKLKNERFDVCVIGAGASGAGVALDAALRGLKVVLLDTDDFASGTSSRSTKLIHGGVRYLEQAFKNLDFGQLKQVKHGLDERRFVLQNAPHLAQPLALMTPVFSWLEGLYFSIGLKLYGWFAKNDTLPTATWLNRKETFEKIPNLSKKVHSAVMYYDGQLDDARYNVALVQTANEAGVTVLNYAKVIDFQKDTAGKICAAEIEDTTTNEKITVKATIFVNCTGAYADAIRLLANPEEETRIRPSKGVHIVLPKSFLKGKEAMLIPKTKDGRVVFVIPFENQVMVGTTDTPYANLANEPILESTEIDYLIETVSPFFTTNIQRSDVRSGFGGIRPLITASEKNRKDTKSLLRDHSVEIDEESGLISLLGGKWTTYRLMAQDTVDAVCQRIEKETLPCSTKNHTLVGGKKYDKAAVELQINALQLEKDIAQHLTQKYGDRVPKLLEIITEKPSLRSRIHANFPFIEAEVIYTVREEMAVKPRDFFGRRTRFELLDWHATQQSIEKVGNLMASELQWNAKKTSNYITEYKKLIDKFVETAEI